MGYNKTTWATGDIVTSEKLNNIENGVSGNEPFIVNFTLNDTDGSATSGSGTADKTAAEIYQAWQDGKVIIGAQTITDGVEMTNFYTPLIVSESVVMFCYTFIQGSVLGTYIISFQVMIQNDQGTDYCSWQRANISIPNESNAQNS